MFTALCVVGIAGCATYIGMAIAWFAEKKQRTSHRKEDGTILTVIGLMAAVAVTGAIACSIFG